MYWDNGYIPPEARKRQKRRELIHDILTGVVEFVIIASVMIGVIALLHYTGIV